MSHKLKAASPETNTIKRQDKNMKDKDIEKQLVKIVELGVTTSNNLNKLALKVVELEKELRKMKEIWKK